MAPDPSMSRKRRLKPPNRRALHRLRRELDAAVAEYRKGGRGALQGMLDAVLACSKFVAANDDWERADLNAPLFHLSMELFDLTNGQIPAIFKLKPLVMSRPQESYASEIERALGAAAVDALATGEGTTLGAAAIRVSAWFVECGRRQHTAARLLAWRKEFKRGSAKRIGARYFTYLLRGSRVLLEGAPDDSLLRESVFGYLQARVALSG